MKKILLTGVIAAVAIATTANVLGKGEVELPRNVKNLGIACSIWGDPNLKEVSLMGFVKDGTQLIMEGYGLSSESFIAKKADLCAACLDIGTKLNNQLLENYKNKKMGVSYFRLFKSDSTEDVKLSESYIYPENSIIKVFCD